MKIEVEQQIKSKLKEVFGFSNFRGNQEAIINNILSGRNTFVIMPTGAGKSLCYQLPAIVREGTAIVISPLIALMKNQVDAIRSLSSVTGIAHVLNSSLNKTEVNQVKKDITSGITKLLYVAPESLTKEEYLKFRDEQLRVEQQDERNQGNQYLLLRNNRNPSLHDLKK